MCLIADFDPERWLQLVRDEHVTVVALVPTMLNLMLNAPAIDSYNLSSVRSLIYGASPMPEALIRRAATIFDTQLLQAYGMTEATPGTFLLPGDHVFAGPESSARRLRSAGRAAPGMEVLVVDDQDKDIPCGDVGEVLLRGRGAMLDYWKQPEATAEALSGGWMHTGDMGFLDQDGFLSIVDRKKDMIISGGENIYSTEVEAVLYQHPAVLEVAVIGVPDATWVEAVKAIVVLKAGHDVTTEKLQAFCRQRIAGYKIPRSVDFVETVPRTATGKINKRELSRAMRIHAATARRDEDLNHARTL